MKVSEIFTASLISALKRKQMRDVIVELLEIAEDTKDEVIVDAKGIIRLSSARIDNLMNMQGVYEDHSNNKQVENAEEVVDVEVVDSEYNQLKVEFEALAKAIAKGKAKKASKILKQLKKEGVSGSVIKAFEVDIDKLKN